MVKVNVEISNNELDALEDLAIVWNLYDKHKLELPGCHTQAKSLDELLVRTKEAIKVYLGSMHEEPLHTKFLGIQKLAV